MSTNWKITALRYATMTERIRANNFLFDDDHAAPHPIDFFIWLLEADGRRILVDTGYDRTESVARERPIDHAPEDMLRARGIDPDTIETVILTHLHFDHAGSLKAFPNAQLFVQPAEMEYATGPCMCHDALRMPFTGDHVCDMVRALFMGRVTFVEGSAEVAPGVEVHLIGGHSRGLQAVRVQTRRGPVVLASDASHFYENYLKRKLFPIVVDAEDMLRGFDRLQALAPTLAHIVPGHDPLVLSAYPQDGGPDAVSLHADPDESVLGF